MWVDEIDITKYTPMIRQYLDVKKTAKDALLFFRLGEFYELFFEDAIIGSRELEIVLTGRDAGSSDRIPMCGIPAHIAPTYFNKLVEKGYKVAVAEQTGDVSQTKGIVKREIVDFYTPGTQIGSENLNSKDNQYIAALCDFKKDVGLVIADLTTGEIRVTLIPMNVEVIISEIITYDLKEIIIQSSFSNKTLVNKINQLNIFISEYDNCSVGNDHKEILSELENKNLIITTSMLLNYFTANMKNNLSHLKVAKQYRFEEYMKLDSFSRESLEITKSQRGSSKKGTLLSVIDITKTAMGGRLLKKWLEKPLLSIDKINKRLSMVEAMKKNEISLETLSDDLFNVYDIERLVGKISVGNISPKELNQLSESLKYVPLIENKLNEFDVSITNEFSLNSKKFENIRVLLENSIVDNPPNAIKDGCVIKEGYSDELDEFKNISKNSKEWISEYEAKERNETNVKSLKIGYNKVFGYYIEVTKYNLHLVENREGYERKQTLANCERYVTPKLKEMENKILGANEKILDLEYQLFLEIRDYVKKHILSLQVLASQLANLDVLSSFARLAIQNGYVFPNISTKREVKIIDGRHPVVEKNLNSDTYVPNNILLDENTSILLVTGPNMSGKSTYMRQIALTAIMAQIGCFVPAKEAQLPVFDQIFTRIGASDDLASGQSTFMVEMLEANNALLYATRESLIIFDELGRGTSTYDGMALAQSILEYIHDNIGAATLFSTHYHELTKLSNSLNRLKNIHVGAIEENSEITFLHKVLDGPTSKSYGVLVAKLAGLPNGLIKRANQLLTFYETNSGSSQNTIFGFQQLDFSDESESETEIEKRIKEIDLDNISPIEALNILHEIKNLL